MLDQFALRTEEAIRQLYVAMTRAKRNLNDLTLKYGLRDFKDTQKASAWYIVMMLAGMNF